MSEKRPSGADSDSEYPAAKRERLDVVQAQGGRFEDAPRDLTVRFLIASEDAGAVIGKGGSVIKHLRTLASSVLLPDSNGAPDRVLSIAGQSVAQILDVLRSVLPQLCQSARADPNTVDGFQPTLRILLLQDTVGGVIGRGGERISELRQSTNTTIKVNPETMPNSTERLAAITGQEDDIVLCVSRILEYIGENPSSQSTPLYFDPAVSYQDLGQGWAGRGRGGRGGGRGRGRGGGGGFGRGGGVARGPPDAARGAFAGGQAFPQPVAGLGAGLGVAAASPWQNTAAVAMGQLQAAFGAAPGAAVGGIDSGVVTEQVTIPDQLAGAIIGPRGARVLKVREQSQCQIKIEEAKPDRSDRVITIVGTRANVHYAQELLQENVRNYSNYGGAAAPL